MIFDGSAGHFHLLLKRLGEQGQDDIEWAQNLSVPGDAKEFARRAIWVIAHGGMRFRNGETIFWRCWSAIQSGAPAASVFRNARKAASMDLIWSQRNDFYNDFLAAEDKLSFLGTMPHIGAITKYHLAKDCGLDYAKPDVHLQRLANRFGITAQEMCERLAVKTGYRIATIDVVLWRACATGVLKSSTVRSWNEHRRHREHLHPSGRNRPQQP